MTIFKFRQLLRQFLLSSVCVYLQEGQVMYFDVNKTASGKNFVDKD